MKKTAWALAGAMMVTSVAMAGQGVTDDTVIVGSHGDLSGPFAAFGAPAIKAAQLYFDEVNAGGGVHGRKIKFIVEDHGYQVPKSVQAVNKLVNRDKVFAMLLSLGTPMNIASFKVLERKDIPNVFPLSAARQMVDGDNRLRFTSTASYYDSMRAGVGYMADNEGASVVCSMYIPSDFGKENQQAAVDEAKARGLEYAAETTHTPDETDYAGSDSKLKNAGCNLVTIALSVRGTISAVATAKKLGWTDVKFLGSSASFHTAIAKVPGGVTDGLFVGAGWSDLETRVADPVVAAWIESYTSATGEEFPGTGALLGRSGAETFVQALQAAGRDLTVESFLEAMNGLQFEDKILGNSVKMDPKTHVGSTAIHISRVEDGTWKVSGTVK